MADASQNKPKKEFAYAIVGTVMFLAIVLLIGISAYLRPAGNHTDPNVTAEETTEEVAVAEQKTEQPTPGNVEENEPSEAQPVKGESVDEVLEDDATATEDESTVESAATEVEATANETVAEAEEEAVETEQQAQ